MFLGGEVVRSTCRREAWHNIKLGDELSDPRSWNGAKSTVTAAWASASPIER
jgi:hypothetical protein